MKIVQEATKKFSVVLKRVDDMEDDIVAHYLIGDSGIEKLADYRHWIYWLSDKSDRVNKHSIVIAIKCDGEISDAQYGHLYLLLEKLFSSNRVYIDPVVYSSTPLDAEIRRSGILFESSFTNGNEFDYFKPENLFLSDII